MRKITRRSFLAAAAACGAAAALPAAVLLHLLQLLLLPPLHLLQLPLPQLTARNSPLASASWCSMPLWMPPLRVLKML